ncbi:DUF4238 domain-containing protein [Pseudomonas monteilii]|uniref:DUF4238 domain-containing protein n=1 Tax=Pseudomonas monteilii TaxID=76759 RepID=UPI0015F842AB|nr:DUF4238 domain-containing protein [Pseudomonas monteilii]MBA6106038.1 DUF4238 domain-containing protein [Pseudomonas monteilii]MCE0877439.1 DUF4238 domain-containing protein [Pseudomonas monteilii]MCE0929492.1 DUF4238 domain-containing protein [Pseudomonas monteilii]MCE1015648.1 DUF4238 domain-containing protein [Pseudomonas monteilii]WJR53145.1 DUF4238 domain-containing protein [Pseudomonas monteilii]
MSGVRQHFIPRFLQKGFRIPSNGKIVRSWVYEHCRPPRPANIADVGLERYFYAVEAETELDDKITEAEQHVYAPLVERLREGFVDAGDASLIAEMLAHFEVRSRHVRENMGGLFKDCTSQIMLQLADPHTLALLLEKHLTPGSEMLDRALAEQGITYEQLQLILRLNQTRLQDVLRPLVEAFAAKISNALPAFLPQITEIVKQGHVKILTDAVSPSVRAARLACLKYSVKAFEACNLPLGDSIVLFHVKGERAFKSFLDKGDEVLHVVLPLSSSQYLLGVATGAGADLSYDLSEQIARCSMRYFISCSDRMTELQDKIGTNAHWLSQAETQSIMDNVVGELLPKSLI